MPTDQFGKPGQMIHTLHFYHEVHLVHFMDNKHFLYKQNKQTNKHLTIKCKKY